MAAKTPVAKKTPKKAVAKVASKQRGRPKGLQLSTAQFQAYSKAFKAEAQLKRQQLALNSAATRFRHYRLAGAHAQQKAYQRAYMNAQVTAIRANAARVTWVQSRLAHQNSALQARVEQNMYHQAHIAGQAKYAQGGVRGYAHAAVMRTVTQKSALAHEEQVFNKLASIARKAGKSTLPKKKFKSGPQSAVIKAAAQKAGLAAAMTPSLVAAAGKQKKQTQKAAHQKASASAKATAAKTVAKNKAAKAANSKKGSQSAKAPVAKAKGRTAPMSGLPTGNPALITYQAAIDGTGASFRAAMAKVGQKFDTRRDWVGDEFTPNCVIAAIANHLLYVKSIKVNDAEVRELTEMVSDNPTIEEVLWQVYASGWPWRTAHLKTYSPAENMELPLLVVGFETAGGDHAALSLDDEQVVSWGSVTVRCAPVEEAWELSWMS